MAIRPNTLSVFGFNLLLQPPTLPVIIASPQDKPDGGFQEAFFRRFDPIFLNQ
jgi:hypothetical protein